MISSLPFIMIAIIAILIVAWLMFFLGKNRTGNWGVGDSWILKNKNLVSGRN